MAIPHFHTNVQSRGKGASAIAKAAYNTGSKLHELDGRLHAYNRKSGIKFRELIFSQKITEPHENREAFWQAVEQSEKRKDACVSREFQAALPRELTYEQNLQLAQEFTQTIIARYDLKAADLAIHYPTKRRIYADQQHENPHLHLQFPDRNRKGEKLNLSRNRNEIIDVRSIWENLVNSHLASAGESVRISLKSNADQIATINAELEILAQREREITSELETVRKELQNATKPEPAGRPADRQTSRSPSETKQASDGLGNSLNNNPASPRPTGRTAGSRNRPGNNADTGNPRNTGQPFNAPGKPIQQNPRPGIRQIAAKIANRINALRYERQIKYSLHSPKTLAKKIASRIEGLRYERQRQYTDHIQNQPGTTCQAYKP